MICQDQTNRLANSLASIKTLNKGVWKYKSTFDLILKYSFSLPGHLEHKKLRLQYFFTPFGWDQF